MLIPLDQLEAHPANANVMPASLLAKLEAHVRATGRCPPLIVRPLAAEDRYQILDGHHRAIVLLKLGFRRAECDVWTDIDDRQAVLLLLTLNRLHGEDDPQRRGALLRHLAHEHELPPDALATLLPDDAERIAKLIDLASSASVPAVIGPPEPDPAALPQAVTFFMTEPQRARLLRRLKSIDRDRSTALLRVLGISMEDGDGDGEHLSL